MHHRAKNVQYLYDSGDDVVFMDEESYEQINTAADAEVAEVLEVPPAVQLGADADGGRSVLGRAAPGRRSS